MQKFKCFLIWIETKSSTELTGPFPSYWERNWFNRRSSFLSTCPSSNEKLLKLVKHLYHLLYRYKELNPTEDVSVKVGIWAEQIYTRNGQQKVHVNYHQTDEVSASSHHFLNIGQAWKWRNQCLTFSKWLHD